MKNLFTLLFVLMGITAFTQKGIVIDGLTNDWNEDCKSFNDADDHNDLDIKTLKVTNDNEYLYLNISFSKEILLNNNNNLKLYLDTDNNSATGFNINGIGAELTWLFGQRHGFMFGQDDKIYHNEIGFVALPTVTSTHFECRIARNSMRDNGQQLFSGADIKIILTDGDSGDILPNQGDFVKYTFRDDIIKDYNSKSFLRPQETDIRILTYNVLHDGILKKDRRPYFQRILRSIYPDAIVFNECWETSAKEAQTALNEMLPLFGGRIWNTIKLDQGNIIASVYPIKESWAIHDNMRLTAALLDMPDNKYKNDFLIIAAHLRCCGANEERQLEADAFAQFILDAKQEGGAITLPANTPILMAGDLNLVGYSQQLKTLLTGDIINEMYGEGGMLDWDNTPLEDVISLHTDEPVAITWRNDKGSFWPGRLDYTIITNSVMNVVNAFTIETTQMSKDRLFVNGLEKNDTDNASDHLPKVTDIGLDNSLLQEGYAESKYVIHASTVNHTLKIDGRNIPKQVRFVEVETGKSTVLSVHTSSNSIDVSELEYGIYILEIENDSTNQSYYEKIIIR